MKGDIALVVGGTCMVILSLVYVVNDDIELVVGGDAT